MIRIFLFAATCIFIFGCGSTKPAAPKPDPLTAFKKIVETGVRRANESPAEVAAINKQWTKWKTTISEPTYDVKKTDSLVSPYSATIVVKQKTLRSDLFATQAEAQVASDLQETSESLYELDYGFQEGAWVIKSARFRFYIVVLGKDSGWVDHPLDTKDEGVVKFFRP